MGQGYRERRRLPIFNVSTLKYGDTVGDWTEPTEQEREEMEAAEKAARAQRERLAAERRVAMRMVFMSGKIFAVCLSVSCWLAVLAGQGWFCRGGL